MTENEKAATFIGWTPAGNKATGFVPAPDMSQPENYMRALQTLDYWSLYHSIEEQGSVGCYVRKGNKSARKGGPITTLAKLYDATAPASTKPR